MPAKIIFTLKQVPGVQLSQNEANYFTWTEVFVCHPKRNQEIRFKHHITSVPASYRDWGFTNKSVTSVSGELIRKLCAVSSSDPMWPPFWWVGVPEALWYCLGYDSIPLTSQWQILCIPSSLGSPQEPQSSGGQRQGRGVQTIWGWC